MHDLSDGFVIPGPRALPKVVSGISASAVQLRTDDGNAFVEVNPTTHNLLAQTTGSATVTAPTITLNGDVTVNGSLTATGNVTGQGTSLHTHTHPGVQTGGGNTGAPN